jgi:hypothetical protein
MARENQGLQIALIGSVLVAILLGVMSFLWLRSSQDTAKRLKDRTDEVRKLSDEKSQLVDEIKELRRMIGVGETEKLADLQAQFKKDSESWLGTFPEKNRFYRAGLEYMFATVKEKSTALADAKAEIQQWKDKFEAKEANTAPVIQKFETAASSATSDYQAERAKIREQVEQSTKLQSEVAAQLASVKKESDTVAAKAEATVQNVKKDAQKWVVLANGLQRKVNGLTEPVPGQFDGEIRWVNQQAHTVWINRGQADNLARLMTFTVYPAETIDMTKATKKGSIEVTQLLGDHLAEARILDDKLIDPFLPGDKINTLTWNPGDQKHFALTGYMDIDGQGSNEYQKVRSLITTAGGVIDAEVTDKSARVGQLSINTRYLVVGAAPDAKRDPKGAKYYNEMITEARARSIELISLDKLLEFIGYQKQMTRVQFGPGGNAADIKPTSRSDGQRVSRGDVSDIFKKRMPPIRAGGISAY